jgi:hypothetical protein
VIQSGIPIPRNGRFGKKPSGIPIRATLNRLAVNECFFFEPRFRNTVSTTAYAVARLTGKRFTTREVPGGYGVWRVESGR